MEAVLMMYLPPGPNLSDADTSLIPKTVEENGNTLQLADIAWQTAAADQMTGQDLAMRYTAVATYTGKASSRYATGHVVTANYTGDVSKTTSDVIVYTAVFSATKEEEKPPLSGADRDTSRCAAGRCWHGSRHSGV